MKQADLKQLELLSRIDRLIERCNNWQRNDHAWEPAHQENVFLKRLLPRVQTMRERLDAPLVVAMFGGTGTGKSSLVNAILGQEIAKPGKQRPTTMHPLLLIHPDINLDLLQLPVQHCDLLRPAVPMLEDVIIVDCPDPDTSEEENAESNLEQLRKFLPHCDVLIYTSTQQKYRSAEVQEELQDAASGCKIVFVQTHADRDVDIRDDWKTHLAEHYEIPEMFFVDSVEGLQQQQRGESPAGELARLQNFLLQQLSTGNRSRIRQENVLDLLYASLSSIQSRLQKYLPALDRLQTELQNNSRKIQQQMSEQLQQDLLSARQLWEKRILESVVKQWGSTPFSWLLRLHNSLGMLLGSFGLMRARTTAHLALLGVTQGARLWKKHQQEQDFSTLISEINTLPVQKTNLQEKRLILQGYAREAGFETSQIFTDSDNEQPEHSPAFQQEFFQDAQQEVDETVEILGKRNSGPLIRFLYDAFFLTYPGFLLYRIGKNFFWDSFVEGKEILTAEFYIPAGVFLLLWCGLFLMMFTRRLRRGLKKQVKQLVERMVARKLHNDMFPAIQQQCLLARRTLEDLADLEQDCNAMRQQTSNPTSLGAIK